MLINAHSTNQSFTFGQTLANKDDSRDSIFTLPFAQSASSDSAFAETLTFGIQPPQPQNTIEIRENLGLLDRIQKVEKAPKILGFPIDDEGYLTATFNKAAGIPESFRIHSETILSMLDKWNHTLTSKEILTHFQQKYERLSEILGESFQNKMEYYTQEELDSLPQAFLTSNGDYNGQIEELLYIDNPKLDNYVLGGAIIGVKEFPSYWRILGIPAPNSSTQIPISIIPNEFELKNSTWGAQKYMDDNGNFSKSGLLAFATSLVDMQFDDPILEFKTNAYRAIQESTMTIEEYVKQYIKGDFIKNAKQREMHEDVVKTQIAFASWLKDKGFSEKDLNEMKEEDFQSLQKNFYDLVYAHSRLQEEEKYSESQLIFFDPEAFLLQLFASHEALDPKLLDTPDSLFEDIERKRALEDERYQPKKKDKETLTQKVKNAGAALAKVEQFLKTA